MNTVGATADPFATLGMPRRYRLDMTSLETRYRELQKALHPDKHAAASASERRMSLLKAVEVNDAYRVLKDELRRAEALLALHGNRAGEHGPADPDFLQQMLELREALDEAKATRDPQQVERLVAEVAPLQARAEAELEAAFDALAHGPDAEPVNTAARLIGRLKYYRRFRDEVAAIEEGG